MITTNFEKILEHEREEGIEKGIEKGIEEGKEKGILQTAKLMKDGGLPVDQIQKFTGLSNEAIDNL